MAGLLTFPVQVPSRLNDACASTWRQWRCYLNAAVKKKLTAGLQQRVLFRIYTGFPFNAVIQYQ
jgi:hypothetical protein